MSPTVPVAARPTVPAAGPTTPAAAGPTAPAAGPGPGAPAAGPGAPAAGPGAPAHSARRARRAPVAHGGDRLALAVASATLALRGAAEREALARRMRLTASAVLLFAAGACTPAPPESGRIRRTAALRALKRLAAQVALAERRGYFDPATALGLLEEQTAVRLALAEPAG